MSTTDDTMSVQSESTIGREYRAYLTDSQIDAVEAAQLIISKIGGCNILGKVGCGKTATAQAVCQERALRQGKRELCLFCMPKMGGVVFDQTVAEANAIGIGDHVYVWKDNNIDELKEFLAKEKALEAPGISAVITNIQRMDAEVSGILMKQNQSSVTQEKKKRVSAKKFSLEERSRAREELFRRIGRFDQLWLDEYQNFAAASPSNDANVEVNLQLTQYPIIDHFVRWNRPSCIIGTTATPFLKHPNDIWAFIRLFASNQMQKRQIMTKTKYGTEEERAEFKLSCNKVVKEMTVVLKHDATPASTKLSHAHSLSPREVESHNSHYSDLVKVANAFKRAIQNTPAHPSPEQRSYLERCKNLFYTKMMLCKRGACHPGLFTPRPMTVAEMKFRHIEKRYLIWRDSKHGEQADRRPDEMYFANMSSSSVKREIELFESRIANEERSADYDNKVDEIVYESGKKFVHTREELCVWCQEVKKQWPIQDCAKFDRIVARLSEIVDERVLIMFEHTDTIELLKLYIEDAMPGREVSVYHAGLSDKARVEMLSHFKNKSSDNAILLSTRGSLKQAVNVECTTNKFVFDNDLQQMVLRKLAVRMFFGDFAESPPDQNQAEGRCKRPKAQGYPNDPDRVKDWFVEFFYSTEYQSPTIETVLDKMSTVKALRCANILTDKSESEDHEAIAENTDEGNKTVINTIIELLGGYSAPNTAHKRSSDQKDGNSKRMRLKRA
jgi:hypothetical protein